MRFNKRWYVFPILTICVLIAYAGSLHNNFTVDDISAIPHNAHIKDFRYIFSDPPAIIRPALYYVTYKIFGFSPVYYRLINLMFHMGSTWVLFLIFSVFSPPSVATIAALIFGVHPITTEAVTWISGGPYAQYSFFILVSFYFYTRAVRNKRMYAISFFFFLCALMSSEKAVVFPGIIIAYELYKGCFKHHIKQLIPIIIAPFFLLFFYLTRVAPRIQSVAGNSHESLRNPFFQIPGAVTSYMQLLLWPDNLTLYHSELSMNQFEFLVRIFITLTFCIAIGIGYKKNRVIFFWLSFFFISLAPTLLPLKLAWTMAERYVYLGSAAFLYCVVYFLFKVCNQKFLKYLLYMFLFIWICLLIIRTNIRNLDWQDETHLWNATAHTSPSDPKTHNNLANIYVAQGKYDAAIEEYMVAIQIKPNYADAYHNMAIAYERKNDIQSALQSYEKAVRFNPKLWQSYQNMGELYFQQKKYDEALKNISIATTLKPDNPLLYVDLAMIYHTIKKPKEATENLEKAKKIDPTNKAVQEAAISFL